MMKASDIRQSYLDFFATKDHKIVPSVPVVPQDDPTLLFINAGMNQFKDVFLGTGTRPYTRAADSQKCIRVSGKHNDLEEVGHDTYHHTFFEMMGNWSFGDYYKVEAIEWAWELVTKVWGLPKDKLYATVFREDDEAEALWKKVTDIAPSHVMRFDEKDNFWEMGATGPCGPCSEIHIDLGEGFCDKQHIPGHVCNVNAGCSRFIELWNLVFIQYHRDETGKLNLLPAQHVDTGLGLERTVAVLQGKTSNYDTDLFTPIFDEISNLTGKLPDSKINLPAFRVIADHIRALTTSITDGVIPSNEGRGYVMRRLLRRAARYGRNLDMREPFIYKLVPAVVRILGDAYPELKERGEHTRHVIKSEEERFNEVLDRGLEIFDEIVATLGKKGQTVIPGTEVFRLYDTFGFPADLTRLMASEKQLTIDEDGFESEMEAQRQRARDAHVFAGGGDLNWDELSAGEHSTFVGYDTMSQSAHIRKVAIDGKDVSLLLDQTPFYGESGGQVGDKGEIKGHGFTVRVTDTQKRGDQVLHIGTLTEGNDIQAASVEATVDKELRLSTARNHTATHLLHKALKEVLGDHVNQAGSLVTPERFRFDFTHFEGLTEEQIRQVESIVNRHVREDLKVSTFVTSISDAKAKGATALFGEKYGEQVRVVQIEDYSMELCGGTHLDRTGQIGYFRILSEEGIAAGVRRIEALTGIGADDMLQKEHALLGTLQSLLKCREDEVLSRVEALMDERRALQKEIKRLQQSTAGSTLDAVLANIKEVAGVSVIAASVQVGSVDELRVLGDKIREKLKSGVAVLGSQLDDKLNFLCVVTDELIKDKKLKAGDIVREVAQQAGGSGGGKPHLALAGAKEVEKLQSALDSVEGIVGKLLGAG